MALPATKATTTTTTHAVVQAIESYIQNQNLLGEIAELDELLYDVIDLHQDNELALQRVLHCIYNLLQNNTKHNVKFGAKVFHKLISVIIADSTNFCRQLVANVLICVQIYCRKFPRHDGKFLLSQLWSLSLNCEEQPHAAQILVQLFDDFDEKCYVASELQLIIKSLLQSPVREYRKSAHFLMRKLLEKAQARKLKILKCTELQWTAYITIMENLEEQQSHLVLPTLDTLMPRLLVSSEAGDEDNDQWIYWLRILYIKLLQDNNILVLRWTLTYFLNHFDLPKLCRACILPEFLEATNRTQLYSVNNNFVPTLDLRNSLSKKNVEEFFKEFVEIKWHSIPLLYWLSNMRSENIGVIKFELFVKLCSRVRLLTNTKLRKIANRRVFELFNTTIDSLSLFDYLFFVENLFNSNDNYYDDYDRLIDKLQDTEKTNTQKYYFFDSINEITLDNCYVNQIVSILLPQTARLHSSQLYWLSCFPLFHLHEMQPELKQKCCDLFSTKYGLNMEMFSDDSNFYEIERHLINNLFKNENVEQGATFLKRHCVDWFVETKLQSWSQIEELHLRTLILLERGSRKTVIRLAELLKTTKGPIEDNDVVLENFVRRLQKTQNLEIVVEGILTYAFKHLSGKETEKLVTDLLGLRKKGVEIMTVLNAKDLKRSLVVDGLIGGDISTGDARIEAAYVDNIDKNPFEDVVLRNGYINYVMKQPDEEVNSISYQLLLKNKKITEKKPRYFENCKEHRLKIRIVRSLMFIKDRLNWSDEMWNALMETSDQLNISYMYECLVAQLLPSFELLLERMQSMETLKPNQQVSLISVAYLYCIRNWQILKPNYMQKVIGILLPQTMGANFQTRLLAQLVLHKFAVKYEQNGIESPILEALMTSIKLTLGSKLTKLQTETRLILCEVMEQLESISQADAILYMTNAPFDEYDKTFAISANLKAQLDEHRNVLRTKKNPLNSGEEQVPMEVDNSNVQRKMNPVNDIFNTKGILSMETQSTNKELIVVASLIDKLPNLGGLARTCEVLGVKTLILNAKSLIDKPDFKNLSMTAEKTLNIMEVKPTAIAKFLIGKQTEGFKIVGAEQTAYSVSFADFQFPEKCVLLLGHEKHGIPVDLIALLDFAVEIPQLGVVRSLNVHVTGSLFIWEYCKQHLNK